MSQRPIGRARAAWRGHELAAGARSGRYSRDQAWAHALHTARRIWWMLLTLPAGCTLALLPLALRTAGVVRGFVIGFALASGLWIAVLAVVVLSGAATNAMGTTGESWTSDVLRKLTRDGWRLVNGFQPGNRGDIDHVLVGPGGVLVVESKWSKDAWPLNGYGTRFMQSSLENAAEQVRNNARALQRWLPSSLAAVPITAIAVLWSAAPSTGSGWANSRTGHSIVVHGPDLAAWLRTELPRSGVEAHTVEDIWSLLDNHIASDERAATAAGATPRPTFWALAMKWAFGPASGAIAAAYGLSFTRFAHSWRVDGLAAAAALGAGIVALRFRLSRSVAVGWLATSAALVLGAAAYLLIRAAK